MSKIKDLDGLGEFKISSLAASLNIVGTSNGLTYAMPGWIEQDESVSAAYAPGDECLATDPDWRDLPYDIRCRFFYSDATENEIYDRVIISKPYIGAQNIL